MNKFINISNNNNNYIYSNKTNSSNPVILNNQNFFHPSNYYFWHSLWHIFIFLTAGLICHTRLMFDNILYPMIYNRTRTTSNSL